MSQNKKNKKNRKSNASKPNPPIQIAINPKSDRTFFGKLRAINKKVWIVIGCIGLMCTILGEWKNVRNLIISDHTKFKEEHTISNELKSTKVLDYSLLENTPSFNVDAISEKYPSVKGIRIKDLAKYPIISIQIGGRILIVPVRNLFIGIDVFNPLFVDCTIYPLKIVAKGDRVYVSTKFIDLQTGNEIGFIEFNHWTLYNDTYLDYDVNDPEDTKFEVKDKQGNIVFQAAFNEQPSFPELTIAGYFVSPKNVFVLNNLELFSKGHRYVDDHSKQCTAKSDSDWKQKSLIEINKIKTIF